MKITCNKSLIVLFCFITVLLPNEKLYSKIIMKPYLQDVTTSSIYVMVEADSKDSVIVKYGLDSNKFSLSAKTESIAEIQNFRKTTYMHRIKLTGLSPDTLYYYCALHNGDKSAATYFRSASTAGKPFRVAVFGDCRNGVDKHSVISMLIKKHKPNFSLYTGDLCFSGTYANWKEEFFIENELNLLSTAPFYNGIGNHEDQTPFYRSFIKAPESKSKDMFYYSFDYGDIHILVLSTQAEMKKGSPQWQFAEEDLKSTDKKWKIVVFHIPAYCAGGKHLDSDEMRDASTEIFEPNKVDLVFSAHNHFYQRNLVNGVYHITVAGGGAPLYKPKEADFVVKCVREHHYGMLEYTLGCLKFTVYNLQDEIIDSFEIKK